MNADDCLRWHEAYRHVAARTRAAAAAQYDQLMSELGYARNADGKWAPAPAVPAIPWQRGILHLMPEIPQQRGKR